MINAINQIADRLADLFASTQRGLADIGEDASDHPGGFLLFLGALWFGALLVLISPALGIPLNLIFWGTILADT